MFYRLLKKKQTRRQNLKHPPHPSLKKNRCPSLKKPPYLFLT